MGTIRIYSLVMLCTILNFMAMILLGTSLSSELNRLENCTAFLTKFAGGVAGGVGGCGSCLSVLATLLCDPMNS